MKPKLQISSLFTYLVYGSVALLCAWILLGGGMRLDSEDDEKLLRPVFLESDQLKKDFQFVLELKALPNGYSKGCEGSPRRWQRYTEGKDTPGYFSYEVYGKPRDIDHGLMRWRYKVHYKRLSELEVELIKIEMSP